METGLELDSKEEKEEKEEKVYKERGKSEEGAV